MNCWKRLFNKAIIGDQDNCKQQIGICRGNGKKRYCVGRSIKMKALVINCSPVRTGATAEIVKIVSGELSERYDVNCEMDGP